MSKRVTIMIDDDIYKKLRSKQADIIKNSSNSTSFSRVVNSTLREKLKN